KDVLAYLRLLVNEADDVSARRVINTPRRGVGDRTIEALDWHARREGTSFLAAARDTDQVQGLAARAVGAVDAFVQLRNGRRPEFDQARPSPGRREHVRDRTGYLGEVQAERTIEALGRVEVIEELGSVVREFHERGEGTRTGAEGLAAFLE